MTVTPKKPSSIIHNFFFFGIFWVVVIVLLVGIAIANSEEGASEAINRLLASGFIAKFGLSLLLGCPLLTALAWYFDQRESVKKWIFTDDSIEIYSGETLVSSVAFQDVSRILFRQTGIGVFTRNPPYYLQVENIDRDLCIQARQHYERREQFAAGNRP